MVTDKAWNKKYPNPQDVSKLYQLLKHSFGEIFLLLYEAFANYV